MDIPRILKKIPWTVILKKLFHYALVPALLLVFLARPIRGAALSRNAAAFLIPAAAACAVGLNWLAYARLYHKRPPLGVYAHGVLCVAVTVIVEYFALPGDHALTSPLADIAGVLVMTCLLLFSFRLAALRSRPAHVFAVGIRLILGLALLGMAYRIVRDIEGGNVAADTWITAGFLPAFIAGFNARRIGAAARRAALRRRATGLTAGWIEQVVGETRLDMDGDPETRSYARVRYMLDDVLYEIRADVSPSLVYRRGKGEFVGREVPVRYDPINPADAVVDRIDKRFIDE